MSKLEFERLLDATAASAPAWAARRDEWMRKLDDLYSQVDAWLKPYVDSGKVETSRVARGIDEEPVAAYEVDALRIAIGAREAWLKPVGTFIIGARGRVDLEGRHGVARLVLVPPAVTRPKRLVLEDDFTGGSVESTAGPMADDVWKWATQAPDVRYTALDEDSFFDELTQVLDGIRA